MHFARKRDTAVFWTGLGLAIFLGISQMHVMAVAVLLMVYLLLDRSSAAILYIGIRMTWIIPVLRVAPGTAAVWIRAPVVANDVGCRQAVSIPRGST